MKRIICIACFVCLVVWANAQDIRGVWVVDEVSQQAIEVKAKKISKVSENVSKLIDEAPIAMVFEEGSFHFKYLDESTLEGGYFIENGILKLGTPDTSAEYKIVEQNGKLSVELANKQKLFFNKTE